MPSIHPTAIVDPRAQIADDAQIDAYAIIEGHVIVGPRTRIRSHSVVQGHTVLGAGCQVGPGAYVGLDPQHLKYDGTETSLIVGDNVMIREGASVHRAFKPGEEHATRIGSGSFLMACSHVAHDCRVGCDVTLANNVMLGGHVVVGDRVFLGGGAGVHQFVTIGRLAMIGGNESLTHDIPPFSAMRYGGLKGYNAIGCRRAGISQASIHAIRDAYHCIHTHRTAPAIVEAIKQLSCAETPEVQEILQTFALSKRGVQCSVKSLSRSAHTAGED